MLDIKAKKKILIANTHMEIGGIESALLALLKSLDKEKYDIDLMIFKMNGQLLDQIPENINVFSFYSKSKFKSLFERIVLSKNIFGKILKHILFNYYTAGLYVNRKKEYDIAIDFSGYYGFVAKYIMKSKAKRKAIWCHSNVKWNYDRDKKYRKKFDRTRAKYKKFDKIIVVSNSSREELAKLMPEHKDKMVNIYNLLLLSNIDETNISLEAKDIINKMNLSKKYKLVSVGRIVKEKAFDRLVDITDRIIKEGKDVETYLVGAGPLEKQIISKINELGIQDSFNITGFMPIEDVFRIVASADLFVGTSVTEGLGIAIIDALTTGIKIVLPNTFGYIDIYNDIAPKGAITLTENNLDSIYEGVKKNIEEKDTAKYTFNIDSINKNTLERLDKLIDGEI